jgi:hypothetical protein
MAALPAIGRTGYGRSKLAKRVGAFARVAGKPEVIQLDEKSPTRYWSKWAEETRQGFLLTLRALGAKVALCICNPTIRIV